MHSPSRIFAGCLFVSLLGAGDLAAQPLRMGGTGSALGLLQDVGAAFGSAAESKIDIIPALGSSGAIRALTDGKLDLAVSARPLKPEEAAAGLKQVAVLRTAFVLATSQRTPEALRSVDIAGIYTANETLWSNGVPIRLILRPRSEADTALMGAMFPNLAPALEAVRRRPEIPTAGTDQDNADMAERTPGSLIGTSASQLVTEQRNLRMVAIDGVAPTFANFESGAYPYTKRLYFVIRSAGRPEAQLFADFFRTPRGIATLRAAEVLVDRD